MMIFLGIVGEIASVVGSLALTIDGSIKMTLEMSNMGYKVSKKYWNEYQKGKAAARKEKKSRIKGTLGLLLFFIPGFNLIQAGLINLKAKRSVRKEIESSELKDALVPMTEEEKEQYKRLKSRKEKLAFTSFIMDKKDSEEFLGVEGEYLIVGTNGVISLDKEALMPLDYTLEEVKKLNAATTFSYRIGKLDDENVAIIGIPNPEYIVRKVERKEESYRVSHTFKEISEEEASRVTFTVYQFNSRNAEKVQEVVEELQKSRANNYSEKPEKTYHIERDTTFAVEEETLMEPQEDRILKKIIK